MIGLFCFVWRAGSSQQNAGEMRRGNAGICLCLSPMVEMSWNLRDGVTALSWTDRRTISSSPDDVSFIRHEQSRQVSKRERRSWSAYSVTFDAGLDHCG